MSTISISTPSDGETIDATDIATPLNTIVTDYNGNIDNSNIAAAAAIAGTKLANGAIANAQVSTGMVVQVVTLASTAVATGTTTIPLDDTIPQNTEGTEFMTLAITPKSATNILVIEIVALGSNSTVTGSVGALFQDSTANALAATSSTTAGNTYIYPLVFTHSMTAGTTSATTFKVRCGPSSAATFTFNGTAAARIFGAISKSHIKITEYKA